MNKKWKDVLYHTGFYRFDATKQNGNHSFKINGFPCLTQSGCEQFIFYTEMNLTKETGVIPVEKIEHEKA